MKYDHPRITVGEPAPGHYIIDNLPSCRAESERGLVVAPMTCYISPAIPSDLLRAILAERELTEGTPTDPSTNPAAPEPPPTQEGAPSGGSDGDTRDTPPAVVPESGQSSAEGVKDSKPKNKAKKATEGGNE